MSRFIALINLENDLLCNGCPIRNMEMNVCSVLWINLERDEKSGDIKRPDKCPLIGEMGVAVRLGNSLLKVIGD